MGALTQEETVARVPPQAPGRSASIDNLKVGLIAGIIAAHALNTYSEFGSWTYQEVREVSLSEPVETTFTVVASFGASFLMGLFFLIAGLFTPASLERKGTGRYVRDRLLRLGVPFAAFTFLLWPLTVYLVREPIEHVGSYWFWFMNLDPFLDNGPMWFIGVLLLYSLAYAAWRTWRPAGRPEPTPLRGRTLVAWAVGIGAATFVVRLAFPADSGQILNVHLWQWPQCAGMFALGVAAGRHGWLEPVPQGLRHRCGVAAVVAGLLVPALIFSADPLGYVEEDYFGGLGWPALGTALVEGAMAVAACVWVLGFAQRRLDRQGPLGRRLVRSAYAAFLIQGPVLLAIAFAMRPLDLPGDAKALVLVVTGVTGSFALAWPLVSKTPLGRVV